MGRSLFACATKQSCHETSKGLRQTEISSTVITIMINRFRFTALNEEVSGVVRAEIARQRRDQKEISTLLGIHPNVLGRKGRREVAFSTGELMEVANALGLSAAEITREAEQHTSTWTPPRSRPRPRRLI